MTMKSKLGLLVGFAGTLLMSSSAVAQDHNHDWKYTFALKPVVWTGKFRCKEGKHDAKHDPKHACDFEFVSKLNGRVWDVESMPALVERHKRKPEDFEAKVEADRSPRFLTGGSYIRVKRILIPPPASAERS